MGTDVLNDEELDREAFSILARELGPVRYARFMSRHFAKPGHDYTRDRARWLAGVTVEEIFEDASRAQEPRKT